MPVHSTLLDDFAKHVSSDEFNLTECFDSELSNYFTLLWSVILILTTSAVEQSAPSFLWPKFESQAHIYAILFHNLFDKLFVIEVWKTKSAI